MQEWTKVDIKGWRNTDSDWQTNPEIERRTKVGKERYPEVPSNNVVKAIWGCYVLEVEDWSRWCQCPNCHVWIFQPKPSRQHCNVHMYVYIFSKNNAYNMKHSNCEACIYTYFRRRNRRRRRQGSRLQKSFSWDEWLK